MSEDSFFRRVIKRFKAHVLRQPQTVSDLSSMLEEAQEQAIIKADVHQMLEGVLSVSDLQARDIMVPRSQMTFIEKDESIQEFLPKIVESGHSRFPVIGEDKDDVIGILLAKDLLGQLFHHQEDHFQIRDFLRPVFFVPESKRLNVLLAEFRKSRNHMAVVVDEYGGVCGLVTIEDVLEEIVGDIEDEHDLTSSDAMIKRQDADHYAVDALTPVETFNEYFDANFSDEQSDTMGGLVMQHIGHLPQKGEKTTLGAFEFEIAKADTRRIVRLRVKRIRVD